MVCSMCSLKKNQQKLWYSTYADQITEYYRDSDGNIIYDEINGEQIPRIKCERAGYNNPVSFYANISAGKGTAQEEVFGVSFDYTKTISRALDRDIQTLRKSWTILPLDLITLLILPRKQNSV